MQLSAVAENLRENAVNTDSSKINDRNEKGQSQTNQVSLFKTNERDEIHCEKNIKIGRIFYHTNQNTHYENAILLVVSKQTGMLC